MKERNLIRLELTQRREEGCDVDAFEPKISAALADTSTSDGEFIDLYDALMSVEAAADAPFAEPSDLMGIRDLRPEGPRRMNLELDDAALQDRILGAWLGRASGCSLGKPVEGWPRERIENYLKECDALPLNDFIPYNEKMMSAGLKTSTRGNIEYMARDDDMDFPILGLLTLERRGATFQPRDMANTWLSHMPIQLLYTAESVAYRNFVNNRWSPESAVYRNPYREWIGAQIRADIFGWVCPAWPELAAEFAFRDASISHVKNGIYGEMWVAAMLAAAVTTDDVEEIIEIGLTEIPAECRLTEAVRSTMGWCREFDNWEDVWDRINEHYGAYNGVHTINNAALVVMGLMFGANDFEKGIVVTVLGGWDTDCTGATVGSILGARFGAAALPQKWVGVLNDRLLSCVRDCNENRISDLAQRTFTIARQITDLDEAPIGSRARAPKGEPGELTGNWELSFGWDTIDLSIQSDMTGQAESRGFGGITPIQSAKVEGERVEITFGIEKGGWEANMTFVGVFEGGDELTGECLMTGYDFPGTALRKG